MVKQRKQIIRKNRSGKDVKDNLSRGARGDVT